MSIDLVRLPWRLYGPVVPSTLHYSWLTILAVEVSLLADKGKSLKVEKYEYFQKFRRVPPSESEERTFIFKEMEGRAKKHFF